MARPTTEAIEETYSTMSFLRLCTNTMLYLLLFLVLVYIVILLLGLLAGKETKRRKP